MDDQLTRRPERPGPDSDTSTLDWIANGNPRVAGVLAEVAARQRRSTEWRVRADACASALHAQLPYEAPALPLCIVHARGARLTDVDGRSYLDCHLGYTAGILGHAPEPVVSAVGEALATGVGAGSFVPAQVELAELVCTETAAERVAFFHTGGQAVEAAVRISRAATGRRLVAKFEGCYHGANEIGLHDPPMPYLGRIPTAPGGRAALPATGGVLPSPDVLVLPFDDDLALRLVEDHADRLAGVVLDPHPAFLPGGGTRTGGFVRALREVTGRLGVPLILDEVVTGFRLARGGAQEMFGIRADLVCYGKITSGLGLPLTMTAGRADLLDGARTDGVFRDHRAGKAWVTSTNAGNPLSVVAALAQLRHLLQNYDTTMGAVDAAQACLRSGLEEIARDTGVDVGVHGHPRLMPMLRLSPAPDGDRPGPYRAGLRSATLAQARQLMAMTFYLRLEGVYAKVIPTMHLSAAHTLGDVAELLAAIRRSLHRMRDDGVVRPGPVDRSDTTIDPV